MNIKSIIEDIKYAKIEDKQSLFTRLVTERLNLALKSYYADLVDGFSKYDSFIENNTIKAAKKFLK